MSPSRNPSRFGAAAACGLALAATLGSAIGCGDSTDRRPAVWEYIAPAILRPNCATTSCHGQAAAAAGLDFSTPERGYTSLTGLWVWIVDPTGTLESGCRPYRDTFVCQRNHRPLVTPYNPSQSRLVHMLRAQGAARMPPDRPLPEADIALVEHWILNGARQNRDDTARDAAAPAIDAGDASSDGAAEGRPGDGAPDGDAGETGAGDGSSDAGPADRPEAG